LYKWFKIKQPQIPNLFFKIQQAFEDGNIFAEFSKRGVGCYPIKGIASAM